MPNLTKSELTDLRDQINAFHQKGIEAAKWGIVYFINAGEGLRAVREALPPRTFKPWLDENFEGGKSTAYKYMKLAEEKDRIKALSVHRGGRIESMRKAFAVLGAYYEEEPTVAITAIQTENPESPPSADGVSMPSSVPASLANGAGGSPAPTEAEQAILDRLLRPEDRANFESGLDAADPGGYPHEYQCYLCTNWFFADQMRSLHSNRYCYSCRQTIDEPNDDEVAAETPVYETTLFDEVPPEPALLPDANGTLPGSNGRAVTTNAETVEPPAMTEQDPYDEMLLLADEIFPLLSSMEAVRTYGIYGPLRRFIELFRQIHQLEQE